MSKMNNETRSTIILFIAILTAVLITVWLILSFNKPNDRDSRGRQTGYNIPLIKMELLNHYNINDCFA
jgi:hypothetical protein